VKKGGMSNQLCQMLFIGQTQRELRIDCEFRYFDVTNDLSRAVSTEKQEKSLIKVGL